ncbi:hypothetical protein BDV36DRAFT_253861 [Aspergillus pseudocaelatus]|uniref:Xylanolytic transcriptional activator regulatory domain-containing protein n=1 Tax=Aspergillus pseudocaelatus TaxID=1825620 RepID=A0ABQ6WNK1_9EURO|nr:hypothetical protein BDV36DRAFT_253861 [Aspergillus pseudocaelatus]
MKGPQQNHWGSQPQPQITDQFVDHFFMRVHPYFPIIEHQYFLKVYGAFLVTPQTSNASMLLCLVVFALGKISSHSDG